jgi:glucosamine-6-phosphate deaminase
VVQINNSLQFDVYESESEVAEAVTNEIVNFVRENPKAKISFPTGSTLSKTYELLRQKAQQGEFSLEHAEVFLLDEYVGLPKESKDSYLSFIIENIQKPCGLPIGSLHYPDVHATDLDEASNDYEELIAGGLDLQILGIGTNGHIGFNEPGTPFDSKTRVSELTKETREANSKYFGGNADLVPLRCITQGLSTIVSAKKIILVATGQSKAQAIAELREGEIDESLPASSLITHGNTQVIIDEASNTGKQRNN